MLKDYLCEKIEFVKGLNTAVVNHISNIDSIRYEVYEDKTTKAIQEFLVINFTNETQVVRNCNGNSCEAILKEIGKYIDGGYYAELDFYKYFVESEDWELQN